MREIVAVFLASEPMDLRGSFDRLAAVTRQVLRLDPASGASFLLVNRRRNQLKALWWDRNGCTMLFNRLSMGTFVVPQVEEFHGSTLQITTEDFARLLAGLAIGTPGAGPQVIY